MKILLVIFCTGGVGLIFGLAALFVSEIALILWSIFTLTPIKYIREDTKETNNEQHEITEKEAKKYIETRQQSNTVDLHQNKEIQERLAKLRKKLSPTRYEKIVSKIEKKTNVKL